MTGFSSSLPTWLDDEQRVFRETVRTFARREIQPLAAEIDRTETFPRSVIDKMGQLGLFSLAIPEEFGGTDASVVTQCIALEELAYATPVASLIVSPSLVMSLVLRYAGGEPSARCLKRLGDPGVVAAVALSEPGAGSDSASISTRAERVAGGYILNGRKQWVTNGGIADVFCIFARTGSTEDRAHGITAFLVDSGAVGFTVAKLENKMGLRGSTTAECVLEQVYVSDENVVGEVGKGFGYVMRAFDVTRPMMAVVALGIAQAALDAALVYSTEREQFGKPIGEFQGMQFLLADMAIGLESARAITYEAARLADLDSPDTTFFASISKSYATDVAMSVTTDAVQVFGGYGYVNDFPVERMMRDAKIFQIFEGTNQIQRMIIGRQLGRWAREVNGS